MADHTPEPDLVEALANFIETASDGDGRLAVRSARYAANVFAEHHRLVSLAPGQIVVGPKPDAWGDPDDLQDVAEGVYATVYPTPKQCRDKHEMCDGLGRAVPVYFGPPQEVDDG